MTMHKAALAVMISLAFTTAASAQLTYTERARAEELARIQARANAKADAEERARERANRRSMAQFACRNDRGVWDYAADVCKPGHLIRR